MGRRHSRLSPEDTLDEVFDQLASLRSQCKQFARGEQTVYKSMSGILRILLVGSSGADPLVKPVMPDATLFPLRVVPVEAPSDAVIAPGEVVVTNDAGGELHLSAGSCLRHLTTEEGGVVLSRDCAPGFDVLWRIELGRIINPFGARISLDTWLEQSFLWSDWTIRKFIKCIANKDGGAHVEGNSRIKRLRSCGYIHWHITQKLCVYLAAELETQLRERYPDFEPAQK